MADVESNYYGKQGGHSRRCKILSAVGLVVGLAAIGGIVAAVVLAVERNSDNEAITSSTTIAPIPTTDYTPTTTMFTTEFTKTTTTKTVTTTLSTGYTTTDTTTESDEPTSTTTGEIPTPITTSDETTSTLITTTTTTEITDVPDPIITTTETTETQNPTTTTSEDTTTIITTTTTTTTTNTDSETQTTETSTSSDEPSTTTTTTTVETTSDIVSSHTTTTTTESTTTDETTTTTTTTEPSTTITSIDTATSSETQADSTTTTTDSTTTTETILPTTSTTTTTATTTTTPTTTTTTTTTTTPEPTCAPLPDCTQQSCVNSVAFCTECAQGFTLQNGNCVPTSTDCPVAAVDSTCYPDISTAISNAKSGAVVTIFEDGVVIPSEIPFTSSITIQGNPKSANRVRMLCNMDSKWGAMFRANGDGQTVEMKHLAFERASGSGLCTVFRTPDLGDGEQPSEAKTTVNLKVDDCSFSGFETSARGGSAIFIGKTEGLTIQNSVFHNNKVNNYVTGNEQVLMWMGGGAVWVKDAFGTFVVKDTVFSDNTFLYPHSLGAGLMVAKLFKGAKMDVTGCTFTNNMASAGGGLYVGDIDYGTKLTLDSTFDSNEAHEFGWKSRGGAVWLEQIHGNADISGSFRNNKALSGRGGAIANNMVVGKVNLNAEFKNNVAGATGAIWDSWSSKVPVMGNGQVSLLGSSVVEGNSASGDTLMYFNGGGVTWSAKSFNGKTITFTANGLSQ